MEISSYHFLRVDLVRISFNRVGGRYGKNRIPACAADVLRKICKEVEVFRLTEGRKDSVKLKNAKCGGRVILSSR